MASDRKKETVIVGLGEILWDIFPSGAVFGGAPANFSCSVAGLCGQHASVYVASGVGDDDLGRAAIRELDSRTVKTSAIQTAPTPTGSVLVEVDASSSAT